VNKEETKLRNLTFYFMFSHNIYTCFFILLFAFGLPAAMDKARHVRSSLGYQHDQDVKNPVSKTCFATETSLHSSFVVVFPSFSDGVAKGTGDFPSSTAMPTTTPLAPQAVRCIRIT
jgi:hypothetical protein